MPFPCRLHSPSPSPFTKLDQVVAAYPTTPVEKTGPAPKSPLETESEVRDHFDLAGDGLDDDGRLVTVKILDDDNDGPGNGGESDGLTVRGTKDEVLARLRSFLGQKDEGEEDDKADSQADDEDPERDDTTLGESASEHDEDSGDSDDGSLGVRSRPRRKVRKPERCSPETSVHDDADSDSDGISLDSDASVQSLSSDSSEARSIVAANKRRRADRV
eukprot:s1331_g12.t1